MTASFICDNIHTCGVVAFHATLRVERFGGPPTAPAKLFVLYQIIFLHFISSLHSGGVGGEKRARDTNSYHPVTEPFSSCCMYQIAFENYFTHLCSQEQEPRLDKLVLLLSLTVSSLQASVNLLRVRNAMI